MSRLPRFKDGQVLHAEELNKAMEAIDQIYDSSENIKNEFNKRIDNFYGKLIEIMGIFIAIFSFIILGIQLSVSCAGSFGERISCSSTIFIPITLVLVLLIILTHKLKR